jgi:hypothetical protein
VSCTCYPHIQKIIDDYSIFFLYLILFWPLVLTQYDCPNFLYFGNQMIYFLVGYCSFIPFIWLVFRIFICILLMWNLFIANFQLFFQIVVSRLRYIVSWWATLSEQFWDLLIIWLRYNDIKLFVPSIFHSDTLIILLNHL